MMMNVTDFMLENKMINDIRNIMWKVNRRLDLLKIYLELAKMLWNLIHLPTGDNLNSFYAANGKYPLHNGFLIDSLLILFQHLSTNASFP